MLVLYGGTHEKYIMKLQAICNNTIRFVTGAGRRMKTKELAELVNWMTVKEMVKYQTLVAAWKVVVARSPENMATKITVNYDRTMNTKAPRLQNTRRGIRIRMHNEWNSIPQELRDLNTLPKFKIMTKNGSKRGENM